MADVQGRPEADDQREQDGLEKGAVENAPIENGTDPLGDNRDRTAYRRQGQFILAIALGVLFTVLAILDFSTGHVGRGALAVVVAVLNAYVAAKEQAKPKAPGAR